MGQETPDQEKKLFLLDAYALIFRAYFAFAKNPRVTSGGLDTSAVYGFTSALLDLLSKENPTHIAVCFDLPEPTERHEIFPEYKANRDATPEAIKLAVPYIHRLLEAFKIPRVLRHDRWHLQGPIGCYLNPSLPRSYSSKSN